MTNRLTTINTLHLITKALFIALFAFPIYPMQLTNVLFMAFAALTLTLFAFKPIPLIKIIWPNLIFIIPFVPYLIELFATGFSPAAHFEFEKKLLFFTGFFFIPLFINICKFNNYKTPLLVFSFSVLLLSIFAFLMLCIKGIPFTSEAYINGSYLLRNSFENLTRLHSTYYSAFAIAAAFFLLNNINIKYKSLRYVYFIFAVFLVLSALYIAARIAFVSICILFVLKIFELKINIPKKIILGSSLFVILLLVSVATPSLKSRFGEFIKFETGATDNTNTISQRTTIIKCSWKVFTQNILTGTGSAHFQEKLNTCYKNNGWTEGAANNFNPHNQYLSMGINYGIFVLILFLAFLFILFRKIIRKPEGIYFSVIIILFFLTESMLERAMGVYFFTFISLLLYNTEEKAGT